MMVGVIARAEVLAWGNSADEALASLALSLARSEWRDWALVDEIACNGTWSIGGDATWTARTVVAREVPELASKVAVIEHAAAANGDS